MPPRIRRKATPRKPAPVVVVKPHPLVWREALSLANGDRSRLEVVSASEVVVRNSSVA